MLALCRTGAVHTTQEISPLGRFEKNPTWLEMICMPEQYREDLFGRVGGQKLSYNSPSGTKLRTPKLPVGKLCRDIYVHMVPFGNWLSLLKFDWRLLTKNDESRANRLTRASLLTSFWRETIAFASKRNPSPCPQFPTKAPAPQPRRVRSAKLDATWCATLCLN